MIITTTHPFFGLEKQTNKLCRPLFSHTPFTHFDYERYSYDGYTSILGLHLDFFREAYNNNLMPSLAELICNTSHYGFLSPLVYIPESLEQDKFTKSINMGKEFGVCHRLCLLFHTPQYVEVFVFGLDGSSKNIVETFMNYLVLLEKFCIYFRQAARDLIHKAEKSRIIFDRVDEPVLFNNINFKNSEVYSDFLDEIKLKKYRMQGKNGEHSLSKREFECLLWIAKDKTAKQIARLLSLSPRTVEDYLASIKNKLGCESKLELIDMANKDPIIKSILE